MSDLTTRADPGGTSRRSRRILIAGVSSPLGGRLAQLLERAPGIETLIGTDTEDPRHELTRTEFVRVAHDETLLRRIIRAAAVDTVVDARLVPDPFRSHPRPARVVDVDGTRRLLMAAGGAGTPVRKLVVRTSAHIYGSDLDGPAFFTEDAVEALGSRAATPLQASLIEVEQLLDRFEADNDVLVTRLRFAPSIGPSVGTAQLALLALPVIPAVLGFDPRWQFVHEDDTAGVLAHAVSHQLPGAYNVAADGVLALSEIAALLGKPLVPVLPPFGAVLAAVTLRRFGLPVPVEMLRDLRHGRGLDNRRLKASGYRYRYTTREAVLKLRAHQRLRPLLGRGGQAYRYEREVEEFLRWSPSVRGRELPLQAGGDPLEVLAEQELLDVVASLDAEATRQLRDHEAAHAARAAILDALDRQIELRSRRDPA